MKAKRCKGITLKGVRCKRKTKEYFCYLHKKQKNKRSELGAKRPKEKIKEIKEEREIKEEIKEELKEIKEIKNEREIKEDIKEEIKEEQKAPKTKSDIYNDKFNELNIILDYKRSFQDFMKYIEISLYLKQMSESDRYNTDDIQTYDIKKDVQKVEIVLDAHDALKLAYILANQEPKSDLNEIVTKYQSDPLILFQRFYKKYFDSNFEIDDKKYDHILILASI